MVTTAVALLLAACDVEAPSAAGGSETSLPGAQARALESALGSGDPVATSEALAAEVRIAAKSALLPVGTVVHIDESRLSVSDGVTTVPAETTGAMSGHWVLVLVKEGSAWRVLAARPV